MEKKNIPDQEISHGRNSRLSYYSKQFSLTIQFISWRKLFYVKVVKEAWWGHPLPKKKRCISLESSFPEFFFFRVNMVTHWELFLRESQDSLRVKFSPVSNSNTSSKMEWKMYRFLSLNLMEFFIPEVLRGKIF